MAHATSFQPSLVFPRFDPNSRRAQEGAKTNVSIFFLMVKEVDEACCCCVCGQRKIPRENPRFVLSIFLPRVFRSLTYVGMKEAIKGKMIFTSQQYRGGKTYIKLALRHIFFDRNY